MSEIDYEELAKERRGMSKKDDGLYQKYFVERTDGKPVGWCFVLEDGDPLAVPALLAYADAALKSGYGSLHDDLIRKVGEITGVIQ